MKDKIITFFNNVKSFYSDLTTEKRIVFICIVVVVAVTSAVLF